MAVSDISVFFAGACGANCGGFASKANANIWLAAVRKITQRFGNPPAENQADESCFMCRLSILQLYPVLLLEDSEVDGAEFRQTLPEAA
jgi:hypothetical protein